MWYRITIQKNSKAEITMKIFNKHSIGNKITSMVIIFVALAFW